MSTAATRKTVECRSVEGVCKQLEKLPVEKPAACSRERRWSQQLPPGRWRALLGLRGGCNHLMPWCSSHHGVRLLQLPEGLIAPSSKTVLPGVSVYLCQSSTSRIPTPLPPGLPDSPEPHTSGPKAPTSMDLLSEASTSFGTASTEPKGHQFMGTTPIQSTPKRPRSESGKCDLHVQSRSYSTTAA
ncbi:uncharacterized protein LOC142775806 isoform X3 [Rhipicephalus microplus]|uniref:uncharacterized protein LOC142775806 isoform X3 n=1 Tax=Rhipicephalus microplus TaxID=6941 RepID=UPI003F6AA3D1